MTASEMDAKIEAFRQKRQRMGLPLTGPAIELSTEQLANNAETWAEADEAASMEDRQFVTHKKRVPVVDEAGWPLRDGQ